MAGPLLHLIQYDVDQEHEDAFDRWYNIHILNVLQFPGYGWSSRYVSLGGNMEGPNIRCLTLYIVEDRSAFNMVLAPTQEKRPKTLIEDQENFETIRGAHYIHSSVYEHVSGSHPGKPLLMENRPLLLLMSDVDPGNETEWARRADTEEIPALLQDPWVRIVGRFRAIEGVLPPWLVQGPRHLVLCELSGEGAAHAMYGPEQMNPALRRLGTSQGDSGAESVAQRRFRYFYKPISQHWSYKKVAG